MEAVVVFEHESFEIAGNLHEVEVGRLLDMIGGGWIWQC